MSVVVRKAVKTDLEMIVKLLKKGKLNVEGIEDHIENFMVLEQVEDCQIVGTAGLEKVNSQCGLLRSLAIDSAACDAKMGMELVRILMAFAVRQGLKEIYLLTRSAPFFHFLGFEEIKWEDIPNSIKQSTHFQQYKQGLSTAMVWIK